MSAIGCKGSLKEYLQLTFTNDDGSTSTVDVYPNTDKLYKVTFYSSKKLCYITVIAKVIDVLESFIKLKYLDGLDTEGLCPCAHKDILLQFVDAVTENAAINSIFAIEEFTFEEEAPIEPPKPEFKEVTKVSILGITTEYIRSIIVRLRIYENTDCCEVTETIPVDMKVGNRYIVSYIDHRDHHTMYEIDGILKAINIDQCHGDEAPNHGFVKHECECNSHDQIGMNNVLYDPINYDMEHFLSLPKDCPEKVSFIFDTSLSNKSTFDTVWLTDIRGVKQVSGEGDDIVIVDPDCPCDNKPVPPALKYPCCGMCCNNADFGKCNGCGTCCADNPCNIPNPCPPIPNIPPCHPPHHPGVPPMPPGPANFADPVIVDNYKVYIGVPDDNFFMTVENAETGEILENVNIRDMIAAYVKQKEY